MSDLMKSINEALGRAFPADHAAAIKAQDAVQSVIAQLTGPVVTTVEHRSPTPSRGQIPNPADAVSLLARVAERAHEAMDDTIETELDGESGYFLTAIQVESLGDSLDALDMLAEPDQQAMVPGYMRAEHWAQLGSPFLIEGLHPATAKLVHDVAHALALKLRAAQDKYGYTDGWSEPDWMDECRAALVNHVAKGDPLDVIAFAAFLWFHKQPTRKVQAVRRG